MITDAAANSNGRPCHYCGPSLCDVVIEALAPALSVLFGRELPPVPLPKTDEPTDNLPPPIALERADDDMDSESDGTDDAADDDEDDDDEECDSEKAGGIAERPAAGSSSGDRIGDMANDENADAGADLPPPLISAPIAVMPDGLVIGV